MATLYLHIGTHKTGSTAIQQFCDENRGTLTRRGFFFPLLPYRYSSIPLPRNAHFLVAPRQEADGSFRVPREERVWNQRMARLAKQFRKYPNILLSDEAIWNDTNFGCKGLLRNLKRASETYGFDIRIIVYLRRQDQYISSMWAQHVKSPKGGLSTATWEEALARADSWITLDYHRHLEEIAAQFGRDAIDVRVYDRDRFKDRNIIADFLDALGLEMDADFTVARSDQNTSIGGNTLEIKRILNALPDMRGAQLRRVRQTMMTCYARERKKVSFSMFSEEELRAFLARYEESNRLLGRDYLGCDASPFAMPEALPPKWEPGNPYMNETLENFIEIYFSQRDSLRQAWLGRFERNLRRLRGFV